jgi:hypothetical protein
MILRIAVVLIIVGVVWLKVQHDDEHIAMVREYNILQLQQETREAVRKKHGINYPDDYRGRRH